VIDLDNRGAQLDLRDLPGERLRPYLSCRRPFHTLVVTWEGQAVLCCVDYMREVKLGDVHEQSVYEIWNGPWALQLRRDYLAQKFRRLPICATCKVG
jgi:radical SAM protein with 4Fe4S-binding SPASM domain